MSPLFMVKKKNFDMYESGVKDVELRDIKPQWKNTRVGDIATIMCGRRMLRRKIRNIHRGSLGSIVYEIGGWRRMFPEAGNLFEVLREKKQIYPDSKEFMAFELI